jgi:hypothetical protein
MVTYWLTGFPCPSCEKTADTKMPMYPFEKDTKRFQEELDFIKKRITSELVTEPSNGWPPPDCDYSWRIGLVKIRTGKKQYSMKCFLCGYTVNEKEFKAYQEELRKELEPELKRFYKKHFEKWQPPQVQLDRYF